MTDRLVRHAEILSLDGESSRLGGKDLDARPPGPAGRRSNQQSYWRRAPFGGPPPLVSTVGRGSGGCLCERSYCSRGQSVGLTIRSSRPEAGPSGRKGEQKSPPAEPPGTGTTLSPRDGYHR